MITMTNQDAFALLTDAEAFAINDEDAIKNLDRETRTLTHIIQSFNGASEWGAKDADPTGEGSTKLIEEGSNALKAVVRTAQSAKWRVTLARAELG